MFSARDGKIIRKKSRQAQQAQQAQQQAQNAGAQQGPQAGAKKDKDNVVDADYKVVNDDDKK